MKKTAIFLCLFLFSGFWALAQSPNSQFIAEKKLYYGTAYYPEAWDFSEIDKDIAHMKALNMNVMRMAEFSWALMEPREGEFDFDWLHKIIEKLHANGISVILGTPTATPPAWMAEKYPEIFTIDDKGIRKTHGARRNCSYTSAVYREKSKIIIEKMAQELGKKPGVIAWQTDNEFHLSFDYSRETEIRWHKWLRQRYGSIEKLNGLWCTQLWSQTYSSFAQVPMPRSHVWHHPSLRLAWYRFNNQMIDEYQDIHLKALRKYSDLPITHDGMPGQKTNYVELFDQLDFMAVNNYHSFEAYDRIQSNYDRMRGYKKGFHWLFETAPNYSGGGKKGNTWFLHQPEGSFFAAIWMNFALGGQGSLFWLWRQHWAGQEMVHGSVLSAWGKPAANYNDLKKMGKQLAQNSDFLMNNPVAPAEAAIFWSHENLFGFTIEEYVNGLKYYNDWTYRFYRPISDAFIHRDVLSPKNDLSDYKLLFMPLMPYVNKNLRASLKNWVKQGGILVLGPMSGYRSKEWTSFTDHALGDFADWTGIEVESRIPIGLKRRPAEVPLMLNFDENLNIEQSEATLLSEALASKKGTILARYQSGMHHEQPAIVENKVGKGKVVLLGTDPGQDAMKALALKYAAEAGIEPLAKGDKGVIVAPRKGKNSAGAVIVNLCNQTKKVVLSKTNATDRLSGKKITQPELTLEPYQVLLLEYE